MNIEDVGEDMTPYITKTNQITRLDPKFDDETFTQKLLKETHKHRKRIVQSTQYPDTMLFSDPETNILFLMSKKGLKIESNQK